MLARVKLRRHPRPTKKETLKARGCAAVNAALNRSPPARAGATPEGSGDRRGEARAVLCRGDEGLDHLGGDEVAVELVELTQPELPAGEVKRRLGRVVRVAAQVAE